MALRPWPALRLGLQDLAGHSREAARGRSPVQAGGLVAGFLHRSHQAENRLAAGAQTVSRAPLILALLGEVPWPPGVVILNDRVNSLQWVTLSRYHAGSGVCDLVYLYTASRGVLAIPVGGGASEM